MMCSNLFALQKLNLVNGVLFTGGWSKSGLYFDVIEGIFKVFALPYTNSSNIE